MKITQLNIVNSIKSYSKSPLSFQAKNSSDILLNGAQEDVFCRLTPKVDYLNPTEKDKKTIVDNLNKFPTIVNDVCLDAYQLPDKDYIILKFKNHENKADFVEKNLSSFRKRMGKIAEIKEKDKDAFKKIGVSVAEPIWMYPQENQVNVCLKKAKGIWTPLFEGQLLSKRDKELARYVIETEKERLGELRKLDFNFSPIAYTQKADWNKPIEDLKLVGMLFEPHVEDALLKHRETLYDFAK